MELTNERRRRIESVVARKFDLQDLWPVEASMVGTVIDATLREVAEALRERGNPHAAAFILETFAAQEAREAR